MGIKEELSKTLCLTFQEASLNKISGSSKTKTQ
jgi:hypothetical protein